MDASEVERIERIAQKIPVWVKEEFRWTSHEVIWISRQVAELAATVIETIEAHWVIARIVFLSLLVIVLMATIFREEI